MAKKPNILREFDDKLECYSQFTEKLRDLLGEIISASGIQVHSITGRTKAKGSLEKKVRSRTAEYSDLSSVTDICGIRVITYFEDDVDKVANAIEEEFDIDEENSVDKRALLDPDRFGYLSLHYVVSLSAVRAELLEYRRFKGLKAEIQVRSILQHAWAEIEHDLGYKTALGVPHDIRREFSRLAGLLEIADREFTGIRDRLKQYETEVIQSIRENPMKVLMDKASLTAFIAIDKTITELDQRLGKAIGATVEEVDHSLFDWYANALQIVGLNTIGELRNSLIENANSIVRFGKEWSAIVPEWHGPVTILGGAVSLMYLILLLAGEADDSVARMVIEDLRVGGEDTNQTLTDVRQLAERARKSAAD